MVTDDLLRSILQSVLPLHVFPSPDLQPETDKIQSIDLGLCYQITDATLSLIGEKASVRYLNLCGCFQVTDAGIISLSSLEHLNSLALYRCHKLTDAALDVFFHLRSLRADL